MRTQILIALRLFLAMTVLTGLLYPLCVTGIAQSVFAGKANGSLLMKNGTVVGSALIGQHFSGVGYFWSRPSAVDYRTMPSGASNLTLTSEGLRAKCLERKNAFLRANHLSDSVRVPAEMIFASASGLDPHISLQAALLQVGRVAESRNLDVRQTELLRRLINQLREGRQWGLFGQPRINVLVLNVETDKLFDKGEKQ